MKGTLEGFRELFLLVLQRKRTEFGHQLKLECGKQMDKDNHQEASVSSLLAY